MKESELIAYCVCESETDEQITKQQKAITAEIENKRESWS